MRPAARGRLKAGVAVTKLGEVGISMHILSDANQNENTHTAINRWVLLSVIYSLWDECNWIRRHLTRRPLAAAVPGCMPSRLYEHSHIHVLSHMIKSRRHWPPPSNPPRSLPPSLRPSLPRGEVLTSLART